MEVFKEVLLGVFFICIVILVIHFIYRSIIEKNRRTQIEKIDNSQRKYTAHPLLGRESFINRWLMNYISYCFLITVYYFWEADFNLQELQQRTLLFSFLYGIVAISFIQWISDKIKSKSSP